MGQDDPALDPGLFTFEYIVFNTHYATRLMEDRGDDTAISHYFSTEPSPSVVQNKVVIESYWLPRPSPNPSSVYEDLEESTSFSLSRRWLEPLS